MSGPKAFEMMFRIKADHPSATGKVHKMAFEAPSEEYLRDSIDSQYEIMAIREIPHPQHAPAAVPGLEIE